MLRRVIPPTRKGDIDGQHAWQWWVFMYLWVLFIFAAWTIGVFTGFGFPGLAKAADVSQLQGQVTGIQLSLLDAQLVQTRRDQCRAVEERNAEKQAFYGDRLRELRMQYQHLTGEVWQIPPCDAV